MTNCKHNPPVHPAARWLLAVGLCWLATAAVGAAPTGPLSVQRTGTSNFTWAAAGVPMSADIVTVEQAPTHGSLKVDPAGGSLAFSPALDFWSHGHDRFEISWSGGLGSGNVTVLLVAIDHNLVLVSSFENNEPLPVTHGDPLEISAAGAMVGALGIYREVTPVSPPGHGSFDAEALGIPNHGVPQGNGSSGEIHVTIDIPPPPGGGIVTPPDPGFWSLLSTLNPQGKSIAEVRVGYSSNKTVLQGRFDIDGEGTYALTNPNNAPVLKQGVRRLRLEASTLGDGLLRVWADDRALLEMVPTDLEGGAMNGLAIGQLDGVPYIQQNIMVDYLKVARSTVSPMWILLLAEDFDGDLSAWEAVTQAAGSVSISPSAETLVLSLNGTLGWGAYLREPGPTNATELSTRFSVDTSGLIMAAGDQLHLLIGYADDPAANNHLHLRLQPVGNDFEIRADAKDDAGVLAKTAWQQLTRGEHLVEMRWRAATASDVDDGYVRLFLDGVFVDEALGIQNTGRVVEIFYFGALGVDDGTQGSLEFDDYVSWQKVSYIQ